VHAPEQPTARTRGGCDQWRTQKILMGGFIQLHMVVICIWCALFVTSQLTSYSSFQTNVLAKFVDIIGICFYTHSSYFMCHCTDYKLLGLQVAISEENKLNGTTQQFITTKISGCVLKQGCKKNSPLRQSNLQRKNQAALQCPVEYEQSRIECVLLGWHTPRFARSNMLNYTQIWECA